MLTAMLSGCGDNAMQGAKQDAREAVQEVKQEVNEVKQEVNETKQEVAQTVNQVTGSGQVTNVDGKFSLGGVTPGMTLNEVKQVLGEPTSMHDNDEYTFANGLQIDFNDFGNVEDIKTYQSGAKTGAGIAVGMTEQNLTAAYGAPAFTENDDGLLEHKYYSGDGRIKIEFKIGNGTIIEIKCSFND